MAEASKLSQPQRIAAFLHHAGGAWEGAISGLCQWTGIGSYSIYAVLGAGRSRGWWESTTQHDPRLRGEGTITLLLTPEGEKEAQRFGDLQFPLAFVGRAKPIPRRKQGTSLRVSGPGPRKRTAVERYWALYPTKPAVSWPWGLRPLRARELVSVAAVVSGFGVFPEYQEGRSNVIFTAPELRDRLTPVVEGLLGNPSYAEAHKPFNAQWASLLYVRGGFTIRNLCGIVAEIIFGAPLGVYGKKGNNAWRSVLPYVTSSAFAPPVNLGVFAPGEALKGFVPSPDCPWASLVSELQQEAQERGVREVIRVDFDNPILRSLVNPLGGLMQKDHLFPLSPESLAKLYARGRVVEARPLPAREPEPEPAPRSKPQEEVDPQAIAVALLEEVIRRISERDALNQEADKWRSLSDRAFADREKLQREKQQMEREVQEQAKIIKGLESRIQLLQEQLLDASKHNNRVVDETVSARVAQVMRELPTPR